MIFVLYSDYTISHPWAHGFAHGCVNIPRILGAVCHGCYSSKSCQQLPFLACPGGQNVLLPWLWPPAGREAGGGSMMTEPAGVWTAQPGRAVSRVSARGSSRTAGRGIAGLLRWLRLRRLYRESDRRPREELTRPLYNPPQ